jgi:subtilase family serine protease
VVTDSTRQVPETGSEDDNTLASSATNIILTPPPDLKVTAITHLREATAGDSISINWTVLNDGTGGTRQTNWSDQVWLSLNNGVIDAGDILLASVPRSGALAPQQAYQVLQQILQLPINASSAQAFLIVRTDAGNQVYEDSFEGNNDRASEIQIFQRPLPDLEVESIVPVSFARAGQPMTVTYTIHNASVIPTIENTWQDSFYLSTDRNLNINADLLLGHRTRTGVLGGNQSETRSYDFVLPNNLSGNYYLIVFTDSANQVVELSDTNNTLATTQVISIGIDPPDLAISSIGVSANPMAGREVTISYIVTNRGNSPTLNSFWQDAIYLSDDSILDANDLRLDERERIGVLAPNQSENRTTTVRLPADRFGTARIIVHSDSSDLVYELNNSNNISSTTIQIGDNRPDLQVAAFALRPNNPMVAPGGTLRLDYEIANRGIGPTFGRSWADRVILSTDLEIGNSDDIVLGSFFRSSDVGAGQSYSRFNQSVTIPSSITESRYWLYLLSDASDVVSELSETNNLSTPIELIVTTSAGGSDVSDLVVSEVVAAATANSGERLPIQWKVQNNGIATTTSSSWFDSVWLSTNNALDEGDIFVGRFARVGSLAPSESYIRSIDWPIGIDFAGSYFTIVRTDSTNTVIEGTGESNNSRVSGSVTNIALSPVPELQVQSIVTPLTAFSGRSLRGEWTVLNSGGTVASPMWTDSVYLSLDRIFDRDIDIPIGFVNRNAAVAAGQSYTVTADLQLPIGIGGNYYFVVVTDSTNRVYERNGEDNNIRISEAPITISHLPPADLVVGDIVVPSNAAMGQLATITFSITNAGQNAARGGWYDAIYISSNDQWDIDDEFMGRVWRAGDVTAGGSYSATLTAPLPGVIPGNYKVIVRSDIRNNLVEANESNNLKASLDRFALDAPSLTLGTPTQGTFSNGQFLYYKVTVPAGETLLVEFNSSATEGSTEMYMSYDAMPRRSRSDLVALKPFQSDQRIILSSTQAGTYYILVHGNEVLTAATPFSILARIVPFSVFDTNFGQGGTAGNRTILIEGAKYDRSVTAELVDSQGRAFPAVNYTRVSDTRLYATFDLTEASIGNYSLRVSKGTTNEQILVPGAFEVVFSLASVQPISLTRPDTFNRRRNDRPPALIPVSLGWRNNTLNDVDVPLIHFSATDPFAASIEDAKAGRTVTSTEFLGFSRTDGPRAVLLPGDFVTAEYFIAPRAVSESDPPLDIHYVAEYFYNDAQAAYNWDYDLSQLDMSYLTDDEAIAAIAAFKQAKGSTLGALREVLAEGLNRVQDLSPAHVPATSRLLIQEVFDRFVASRMTSLRGKVEYPNLKVDFSDLAITIKEVGGTRRYSSAALADGSFVFPKVEPGTYEITVSGGSVTTNENIRVTIVSGQKANLSVTLVNGPNVPRVSLPARNPVGNSPVAAPWITHPGKMSESLSGNVLESVLGDLSGRDYTVELIGDFPKGFSLEPDGSYQFYSNETVAFVVHYDLVLKDLDTRVGRLFGSEIRSRGAIAITLKNNFTRDVRALDPNDIIGPAGYGDEKWVSANEQLAYKIRFENDPRNAMAPALSVNIQQTLSEHLDPRTFEFGSFGFGGREFEVPPGRQSLTMDLDLRDDIGVIVRVFARVDAQSRRVTWTFTTISPLTSDESVNPDEGFLPVNLTPPEGDGFVSYTVRARRTSPTGSKITAEARIIFDGNVPIDTPQIFNTLDATRPESTITTTTTNEQNSSILVRWSGHDGQIGSGLARYDVFVSEGQSRYVPWLTDTNLIEAEYRATAGQTLRFLTLARDNVGNLENDSKFPEGVNADFGDAPSASQSGFVSGYPTTLAQDGARHRIGALRLGANIDAEPDGTPSVDALLDDSIGLDDEDGIQFVTPILASSTLTNRASVVVTASGVGKLDAWIDFNRDGDWNDPGEQIFVSANVMAGRNLLSFTVPTGASVGASFARFRISTLGSLGPTGLAQDGEVEDYRVELINAHQTGLNLDLMDRDIGQHELLIIDGRLEVRKGSISVLTVPASSVALVRLFDDQQNIQYRVETPSSTLVGILQYKSTDLPVVLTSSVAMMDLSAMSGKMFGMDVIDVTAAGTSVIRVSPGSISSMNSSGLLRLDLDKEDRIQAQGLWRYTAGRLEDGEAVHRFTSGGARLDVHSENAWQNPLNRLDVDGDGLVSPLDVLALINAINIGRGSEGLPEYDPESAEAFYFFDVMGDGDLSPLDVLQVINAINSSQMEAEGESGQGSKFAEIKAESSLTDLVFASDWDDETLFANRRQNNLMSPRRSSRL